MSLCIFLEQHLAGSLLKRQMKSTLEEMLVSFLSVFLKTESIPPFLH